MFEGNDNEFRITYVKSDQSDQLKGTIEVLYKLFKHYAKNIKKKISPLARP